MKNKNSKVIIYLLVFFTLIILIFLLYLKINKEDRYFPYWDPYITKEYSLELKSKNFGFIKDNLFYYNSLIYHEISTLDFYYIIKYGNFFILGLIFLGLYLFKNSNDSNKKSLIFFFIFIFLTSSFLFIRFSMLLRENLVIFTGIIFIYFIDKYKQNLKRLIFLFGILLAYIIGAHILTSLIILGSLGFLILFNIKDKSFRNNYLHVFLLGIIISSIFIYYNLEGIIYQLNNSSTLLSKGGFDLSYNFIKLNYFSVIEIIIFLIGSLIIVKEYIFNKKNNPIYKSIFFYYIIIIILGILLSFISIFASKQNRFFIYLELFLSFTSIYFLSHIRCFNYKKLLIPILILIIIIIPVLKLTQIQGYRPINTDNIEFVKNFVSQNPKFQEYYCYQSSSNAIKYLNIASCNEINFSNLNNLDKPLILFKDDVEALKIRFPQEYLKIEIIKNQNSFFYDNKSRSIVIYPKNET